jgi:predicted esterase
MPTAHAVLFLVACIVCQAASAQDAPASPSSQLLTNASFEDGDRSPTGWQASRAIEGVDYIWERRQGHTGSSSLCLRKTIDTYMPIAHWAYTIRHQPDPARTHLRVGGWVKAQKVHKALIDVQFESKDGEWSHKWASYIGARSFGDPPADHDWKRYEETVAIPGDAATIRIALQIYGPGTVWFDDVSVEYVQSQDPAHDAKAPPAGENDAAPAPIASADLLAGDDPKKRFFLVGPHDPGHKPETGYKLLLVLPGGDGSADFQPFVSGIFANSLSREYLLAQLVAPKWSEQQADTVVWPKASDALPQVKFSTEEFIFAVVEAVKEKHAVDPRSIYTLSWSSGGPAAYAASLTENTPITGSFVAMSVFKPDQLPGLARARGKAYYILHSPQDFIGMSFPEAARDQLAGAGATTRLATYEGGHGWHGDPFANIRAGIAWLEEQTSKRHNVETSQ